MPPDLNAIARYPSSFVLPIRAFGEPVGAEQEHGVEKLGLGGEAPPFAR